MMRHSVSEMWSVSMVLFVFVEGRHSWITDVKCLTEDGTKGRCMPPSECTPLYHGGQPHYCRISRGHGPGVCCPQHTAWASDEPISFPSEAPDSHNRKPHMPSNGDGLYNEGNKRDRLKGRTTNYVHEYNGPNGGNNHNGLDQVNRPSYENGYDIPLQGNRPSSENSYNRPSQGNMPSGGSGYNGNRPAPLETVGGEIQFNQGRRTSTPRPIWELDHSHRETSSKFDKRISEIKCEEYSSPVTESIGVLPLDLGAEAVPLTVQKCSFTAVKLIVGGVESALGEFPHMAAIGFHPRSYQITLWNCGGTLISDQYVLTAAHCINTTYGMPAVVRLGEYNLASDSDGADHEDYRVEQAIVHPDYSQGYKYNDIALLKLDRKVTFNTGIRPACLAMDDKITTPLTATGWGRTNFVGKQSNVLMKVNLDLIDNRQCNTYYRTDSPASQSFNRGIVETMLCAGEVQGGRDTCMGDSGGPLTVTKNDNPCIQYVVGITSFGKVCGAPHSPGVYTKVYRYLSWIERTVWQ